MDNHSISHRRTAVVTAPPAMDPLMAISKPAGYLVQLAASPLQVISSSLISLLSESSEAAPAPSRAGHGGGAGSLLRRLSLGLFAAIHAVAVLVAALVVAVVIGVVLVRLWVEEPVVFRQPLHFDYTNAEPTAVALLGEGVGKGRVIPAGHTTRVSLQLLMPESDYNRHVGVFQVTAEVRAAGDDTIATSSQPCMLRFRSLPVRLMRTFIMGIPLLVGMSSESQTISFEILRYKESNNKPTVACYFKPFAFSRHGGGGGYRVEIYETDERSDRRDCGGEMSEGGFSDALKRWRELGQGKRKASLMEGSGSSVIVGGETSEVIEDIGDFAVSESSECVGG